MEFLRMRTTHLDFTLLSAFYLLSQEAKQRFEKTLETKEKCRQEKIEEAEKRQREIYLNGGYVDCCNPGI